MLAEQKKGIIGAKMLLLVVLLLLVISAMGAVIYFVTKNYRQLEDFNDAITAYESENWELASKRLQAAIVADPNNEDVVAKLATVNEKLGYWTAAGFLWSRAAELNAFKPEYFEHALSAHLRAGNFELLREELATAQPFKTDRHRLLMALVHANAGELEDAKLMMSELSQADAQDTPLLKLVELMLEDTAAMTPEQVSGFEALANSEDAAIALIALYNLANDAIGRGEMSRAQDYLERRILLSPKQGTISLANFYYIQGKSKEAADLYRELVDELIPIESIRYAESLVAIKQIDELQELAKRYRIGARVDVLTGYYIDALLAYEANDAATVSAKLQAMGDEIPVTLIAQMLTFYDAVQRKDIKAISTLLSEFPYDAHERLAKFVPMIQALVMELITENNLTEAAHLSELLNIRDFQDVAFTLAQVGDAAQKQVLSRMDLDQALEAYPREPRLWSIATDYHLRNRNFSEAQAAAEKLLELIPGNVSAQLQRIAALESMPELAKATQAFEALYQENPSDRRVLIQYLAFCSRNQLSANLSALLTSLQAQADTALIGLAVLAEAELAQIANDREKIYTLLQPLAQGASWAANSENAAILYRAANMLATNDYEAPAIKIYRKLLALAPNSVPVLVNLAELYAALAEKESDQDAQQTALELAKQAYTAVPQSAIARECYALRLNETGSHDEAQKLLLNLMQQETGSPRVRLAWKDSMEHLIEALAKKDEIYNRTNLCQSLLNEFPQNEIATQNLQSIQEELQRRAAETEAKREEETSK